jgi:serine/threonine protein kinase
MITGDYTETKRTSKSGRPVVDKVVVSTTNVKYAIGNKFDAGGQAIVYKAMRCSDKKLCVFKEYVPNFNLRREHNAIKNNIKNLMFKPITDDEGKSLESFIGPMDKDSLIELPASKGFGYIMELVDTKTFLSVPKLWHKNVYPDSKILCIACVNLAYLFRKIHEKGWCYKDINEGNIFVNNKTGEIRMIDCENISVQNVKTIFGLHGFIAPEVYVTGTPDIYTDYFSMSVLYYRLLVGGFPFDGKKTFEYLISNNLSIQEAASTIYGKMALFAFDPKDSSNEIRNLVDPRNPKLYEIQTKRWNELPDEIQKHFIKTFSTGLSNENRYKRIKDREWISVFQKIEKSGLVKCQCGKFNFGESNKTKKCNFCGTRLPLLISASQQKDTSETETSKNASKVQAKNKELTSVVFQMKRDIAPTQSKITIKRNHQVKGSSIYPTLNDEWVRVEYSKSKNLLSVINMSTFSWIITDNNSRTICNSGERLILKKGAVITVLKRQLELTVLEIK